MDSNTADDNNVSFHLGEMFNSYEELENKLEKFSKRSLVHYWRRDSRTVSGAHMKTARPISERLKYYSVKYACIYGGQKFLPRGAGRRQSQSIRTNCPAHIMLRASKDGTKLEVTSVNNEHNHEISEELFKKLPQERKLCGEIKQEVQDLMQLHIDRKRLKEYVRLRTNKILRSKDLFNIAAANKQKREITPERAYQLFKRIHDLEKLQGRDSGRKAYSESEDEISQRIKRIKKDHSQSPWGQDGLSAELEVSEGNDGDDSYGAQLTQEEVIDDMHTTEGQLLRANNEGNIITANGEIVCELVMENGDPSVIVESIVNTDGSVFEDEREFNSYCDNHLTHSVHDSHSPVSHVLDIETISAPAEISKISKPSPTPSHHTDPLAHSDPLSAKISNVSPQNEEIKSEKIWLMKESTNPESEADSSPESESGLANTSKNVVDESNELGDVVFSEEASHQLLHEQLAVLRAEKSKLRAEESKIRAEESKIKAEESKLFHEIEMLKLKKDKIKLQMSYYTNENRKEEVEKELRFEKLRLKIKLLQSKVVENNGEISHYIFVP